MNRQNRKYKRIGVQYLLCAIIALFKRLCMMNSVCVCVCGGGGVKLYCHLTVIVIHI